MSRTHYRHVGSSVNRKTGGRTHRHDQHPSHRGTHHSRTVHDHAVETHRAGQILRGHKWTDEGLASRGIDNLYESADRIDHYDQVDAGGPDQRQDPQHASQDSEDCLGNDEELAKIDTVSDCPAPRPKNE